MITYMSLQNGVIFRVFNNFNNNWYHQDVVAITTIVLYITGNYSTVQYTYVGFPMVL